MASSRESARANEVTLSKDHRGESAPRTLDSTY
jgi:hypothetical protein